MWNGLGNQSSRLTWRQSGVSRQKRLPVEVVLAGTRIVAAGSDTNNVTQEDVMTNPKNPRDEHDKMTNPNRRQDEDKINEESQRSGQKTKDKDYGTSESKPTDRRDEQGGRKPNDPSRKQPD